MTSGAGLFFARSDRHARTSSYPAHVTIAATPFGPFQCTPRGNGGLDLLVEVDAPSTTPTNPSPLAHDTDVAEQARSRRKAIESCHVAVRVNAMEMNNVLSLHAAIVAAKAHAV
jgi:hypothetical protein